ncbi:MAG: hypothetical protein PHR83_18930 [Paludibacter sp.]|nr:hypothetical protein [Paludibacter sp.]
MKKLFTIGIFLAMLIGIGSNVMAATFTSRLSSIAGVSTARGYSVGLWGARATWYDLTGVTDTTTLALPTYNDDVIIPATDSVFLGAAAYSRNLTVNGTLCMNSGAMYINGDLTVNSTGIFSIKSSAYCKNVNNYGKIWAWSTNYNTARAFCVGYTNQGTSATTIASADSITIYNDGIIGGSRDIAAAGGNGCGFYVYYSNQAKALNITGTAGSMPNRTFNAGGLVPGNSVSGTATSTAATQNFNLYIRNGQSLAFFVSASPSITSLQNGDVFTGYTRTCTIEQGASMYVATSFHCKAAAPTASQGAMVYNIFGTLDLGTYNRSKNEFDLYTSAGSSSVSVNVKNGGALVFGKVIGFVQSASGQTTALNPETGSTVKFGYTASAPTITTTVAAVATPSIFPVSYSNLGITTGTFSVTLPAGLNYKVGNALTLTTGNLILGTSSLKAGSISGGSSTSYVVTNSTGVLTQNALTTGTLFPIGTATAYAPVMVTPAANDTVSATVTATATGTFAGYAVNANEWTLTPQVATTATLAFTPATATNTTAPAIFSGAGYAAKTDATLTGSTYSASGVNLDAAATIFATGGTTPATAIASNTTSNLLIYSKNNSLVVRNAKVGDVVSVYGISGLKVASSVVKGENTTMTLTPGVYIVKTGSTVQKVSVL